MSAAVGNGYKNDDEALAEYVQSRVIVVFNGSALDARTEDRVGIPVEHASSTCPSVNARLIAFNSGPKCRSSIAKEMDVGAAGCRRQE